MLNPWSIFLIIFFINHIFDIMNNDNINMANANNNTANDENVSSIHEFDFSLICEYFSSISRQGPGSDESTLRALSMIGSVVKF